MKSTNVGQSELPNELCNDCGNAFSVPFDNGDGLIRCEECAVNFYMKKPAAFILIPMQVVKMDVA